jgi:hypothetical protein
MRSLLLSITLLLAATTFAQQSQPPGYPPPTSSQQTSPDQQIPPYQRVPEAQEPTGPGSQATTSSQVGQQIQEALQAQPSLSNAKIRVSATSNSVVLSGVVADEEQHQKALRVATLHASGLQVVDRIKVQQKQ